MGSGSNAVTFCARNPSCCQAQNEKTYVPVFVGPLLPAGASVVDLGSTQPQAAQRASFLVIADAGHRCWGRQMAGCASQEPPPRIAFHKARSG